MLSSALAVALFAWPLASRPPAPLAHANRREVVVSGCAFATSPIALLGAPARSTAATDGSSWAEHTGARRRCRADLSFSMRERALNCAPQMQSWPPFSCVSALSAGKSPADRT